MVVFTAKAMLKQVASHSLVPDAVALNLDLQYTMLFTHTLESPAPLKQDAIEIICIYSSISSYLFLWS